MGLSAEVFLYIKLRRLAVMLGGCLYGFVNYSGLRFSA